MSIIRQLQIIVTDFVTKLGKLVASVRHAFAFCVTFSTTNAISFILDVFIEIVNMKTHFASVFRTLCTCMYVILVELVLFFVSCKDDRARGQLVEW